MAALRDLGLLDTPGEEAFDRPTRLASDLLGVPVSLVSLVDADRQFVKSQQGLDGVWAIARQTPLTHSFCQHAMATKQPLVISDAREHPLVSTNPAILDLGVVAYAGMPLVLDDGHAVGALCPIDHQPREWTNTDLRILKDLAAAVTGMFDLRAELAHQGLYDTLTGLPNRTLLVALFDQLLQRVPSGHSLAVMCFGVDGFSQINQAFGADHADATLRTIAERLGSDLRPSDVLGRLRGDIFTVCATVADEQEAGALSKRLRATLADTPLPVGSELLSLTATTGIAISGHSSHAADLISESAYAMRQAKRLHAEVQVSQDGWTELATSRLRLQEALQGALANDQLTVVYQPVVELKTGQARGFETLARWHHPDLGQVSPAEFIPVAEATGLIIPIGQWILTQACPQLAQWRASGDEHLHITANVAPPQLQQPNFAETAAQIIRDAGLPGNAVTLEITEGVLLEGNTIQQGQPHPAAPPRDSHRVRRLRDRLLGPGLPQTRPDRHSQDRSVLRQHHGHQPPRRRPSQGHSRYGSRSRAQRRCRGDRNPRAAPPAPTARLRLRPGLPLLTPKTSHRNLCGARDCAAAVAPPPNLYAGSTPTPPLARPTGRLEPAVAKPGSMRGLNRPGVGGDFWPWKIKDGVHAQSAHGWQADGAAVLG